MTNEQYIQILKARSAALAARGTETQKACEKQPVFSLAKTMQEAEWTFKLTISSDNS
jgi:hypothetical protein